VNQSKGNWQVVINLLPSTRIENSRIDDVCQVLEKSRFHENASLGSHYKCFWFVVGFSAHMRSPP